MLHLSSFVVLGCVACALVGSWAYFRRYQVSRPPIGVFNGRDLVIMVPLLILVPLLYLILPLWLTACALAARGPQHPLLHLGAAAAGTLGHLAGSCDTPRR